MRLALSVMILGSVLLAPQAQAQFQNRGIGFNVGFLDYSNHDGVDWGIPLGLHHSNYIDNNIEFTTHLTAMLAERPTVGTVGVGLGGQIGARYLFMTDVLRPYVGAHLSYFGVYYQSVQYHAGGIGPNAGLDYFLNDSWSIGARGQFTLFVQLGEPLSWSYGGGLELTTWY